MEMILVELLLWAGLIFFFWALRDGLNHVESELETQDPKAGPLSTSQSGSRFDRADQVSDQIGRYCDSPIFRYAVIDGKRYQFKHILAWGTVSVLQTEERCLAPGLVYSRCRDLENPL